MTALLVALGAAVGAPLRYALAHLLDERWPTGTLLANTLGSGLLGLFAALALDDRGWALLGTGFCGAFTTFSSFAVQAVDRPRRAATAYVVATTVLAVGGCALGWALGTSLAG
ncbi:CrcB family protein [Microbacterium sp. ARD31]|uniref:fluoride efflux transporter FluC n=1 Tax=Microbacterium sp. ARD31 TaxID=2962576 RepID=UPI002881EDFE|nr:CrcB family protein [Microbacterium sp. ARD31]MDT0187553.1 CrcB family protein [Microbacterium sp. ARD31]